MSTGIGMPTAAAPTAYQNKEKDHSTTHSAVEEGVIIIRDKDKQQQDINTISRDTENANNELDPIFDKQKELDRIEKIELVADIASQAKDLAQKYSRMQAEEKYNALSEEERADINAKIKKDLEDRGVDFSEYKEKDKQAVIRDEYIRQVSQREGIGNMGDGFSKGIDAATSIVIGIIKGDITGGLAGASAPYLATLIKENTYVLDEYGNKKLDENGDFIVNKPANLAAHAILGAVVAELQGNSGLSGGMGALTGEFAATYIREYLYGKKVEDLTEAEKRNISSLSQLASGLAVASVGGNTSDISAAIASSKNAVENNSVFFGAVEPEIKLTEETKDVYDICPKYDSHCITAYFYSKGQPSPYPNVTIPKEVIEASTLLPSVGLADSISIASTGKNLAGDEVDPFWGWLGIITAGYGQKARVLANFENKVVSATIKNSTGKEATSTTSNKGGSVSNPKEQSSNPVSKPAEVEIGKEATTTGQTSSSTSKPTSSVSNETVSTTPNKGGSVSNPKEQSSSSVSKPEEAGKGTSVTKPSVNVVPPKTMSDLNSDLISKGFELKSTSGGGYITYKHADGRMVTIKPTGEVIPTKPKIAENGKKYNERTDYDFNRLEDQSHSTGHFINRDK